MGVNVSQAFHRTSVNPIDDSLVLTKNQMLNMNPNIMPTHYFAICSDDNGLYIYDKTQQTPDIATGYFKKFVCDINPMIFMGLVGTDSGCVYDSTTFPAASASNKGYVYKVVTNATYQGVAAKLGDTLISTGTAWVLIPSGDEVTYTQGTGITISGTNNAISVNYGTTAGTACEGNDSRFNNIFYKNVANTVSGATTFSGSVTISNSSLIYSGIQSATGNAARSVWFADSTYVGKPVYNSDFTYNPSTGILTTKIGTIPAVVQETVDRWNNQSFTRQTGVLYLLR